MIELIFLLIFIALYIWMIVWACKKKGILGFLLTFFLFFIGAIIVAFLPSDEQEREREKDEKVISIATFATSNILKIY